VSETETETGRKFDPYKVMLEAYEEAQRERVRITHWRVNYEAVYAITAHPITMQTWSEKPVLEREFLGIPLQLDRDNYDEAPGLSPVFETYGRHGKLIHNYDGPIRHGNQQARFIQAAWDAHREAVFGKQENG
jgi:hypothetical protein